MNQPRHGAPSLRALPREWLKLGTAPERSDACCALRALIRGEDVGVHRDPQALASAACQGEVELWASHLNPAVSEALGEQRERAQMVELSLVSAQARIAEVLHEAGLGRVALLKGSASAWTLYPSSELRARRDVDLLVSADALPAVVAALRGDGWRDNPSPGADLVSCRAWAMALDLPVGTLEVDLHRRLVSGSRYQIDEAAVLDRAVSGVTNLPVVAPEDLLLHTCVHAGLSGFMVPLKSWVDVDRLLRSPDLSTERVLERSRAWEVSAVTWACLQVVRRWFHTPVDTALHEGLRPPLWQARALTWLLQGDGAYPLRRTISKHAAVGVTAGLICDRPRARARHLLSLVTRRIRRKTP